LCSDQKLTKLLILLHNAILAPSGMYCRCVSVCLSHASIVPKTAKYRITQKTPYDSPGTLVFLRQRSRRNSSEVARHIGQKSLILTYVTSIWYPVWGAKRGTK